MLSFSSTIYEYCQNIRLSQQNYSLILGKAFHEVIVES